MTNPCDLFTKMILRKIKSEQVASLQFNINRLLTTTELAFLSDFDKVTSVTLHNISYVDQINRYIKCLPKLTRLSLYYDDKVTDNLLSDILNQLQQQIRRFEIHCPAIFSTEYDKDHSMITSNIEYFLLDIGHYSWTSTNERCYARFFMRITNFKKMPNIQRIHFIINKYDIEHFLDDDQWKILVKTCSQLKKIILQVLGNTFQDKQYLVNKILEIQTILRAIRPTIKFQITFL